MSLEKYSSVEKVKNLDKILDSYFLFLKKTFSDEVKTSSNMESMITSHVQHYDSLWLLSYGKLNEILLSYTLIHHDIQQEDQQIIQQWFLSTDSKLDKKRLSDKTLEIYNQCEKDIKSIMDIDKKDQLNRKIKNNIRAIAFWCWIILNPTNTEAHPIHPWKWVNEEKLKIFHTVFTQHIEDQLNKWCKSSQDKHIFFRYLQSNILSWIDEINAFYGNQYHYKYIKYKGNSETRDYRFIIQASKKDNYWTTEEIELNIHEYIDNYSVTCKKRETN